MRKSVLLWAAVLFFTGMHATWALIRHDWQALVMTVPVVWCAVTELLDCWDR